MKKYAQVLLFQLCLVCGLYTPSDGQAYSESDLEEIFQEVIDRIPENYGSDNHQLRAYFRNYTFNDGRYGEMIEAFVRIKDNHYLGAEEPRKYPSNPAEIYIQEMRRTEDNRNLPPRFQYAKVSHLHVAYEIMNEMRGGVPAIFPDLFLRQNRLYLIETIEKGEDQLLRIGFGSRNSDFAVTPQMNPKGEILVNLTDYAVLRFQNGKGDRFDESVYQKIGDKYYPLRIISNSGIKYDNKTRYTRRTAELYFLEIAEDRKAAKGWTKGKLLPREEAALRQFSYKYNAEFWINVTALGGLPDLPDALEDDLLQFGSLEEQFEQGRR